MAPDNQLWVPLLKVLTDAHATADRIFNAGIGSTEHCKHCLCENSSVEHILCHCPRFEAFRAEWPQAMKTRPDWPACASNALICTKKTSDGIRDGWPSIQRYGNQLLSAWMAMQRDKQTCLPFAESPNPELPMPPIQPAHALPNLQQVVVLHNVDTIDLEWRRPLQT